MGVWDGEVVVRECRDGYVVASVGSECKERVKGAWKFWVTLRLLGLRVVRG